MTQPEGSTKFGYDPAGRLSSITDWNIDTTSFFYDTDGRIETITRSNGVVSGYSYGLAGRLNRVDHDGRLRFSASSCVHDQGPTRLQQQLRPCLSASHRDPTAIAEA